jgi:hypothetical protein
VLSRDERRLLAEIERRFHLDDPRLARRLARGPRGRRRWLKAWGLPLLIALAGICELLGLVIQDVTVVIIGLALFGVVLWATRRANHNP